MRTLLVSAADSGYFSLLEDLIASIAAAVPEDRPGLGILDLGLDAAQRTWLRQQGAIVVEPDWTVDFADRATRSRTYLAQLARPFLPDYFPGAETLLWIDADCWVQDGQGLVWPALAAATGRLAIAQEAHPAYRRHYTRAGLYGKFGMYRHYFGADAAESWGFAPSLNVGLLALRADAPHWAAWQQALRQVLAVDSTFYAEQLALDFAVFHHGLPVSWLPARANWLCHQALPAFCPQRCRLTEPTPPFDPLWVLHLTMGTKQGTFDLDTAFGGKVTTGLRWHQCRVLLAG